VSAPAAGLLGLAGTSPSSRAPSHPPNHPSLRLLRRALQVLSRLPPGLRASLLEERDPHGNVQVGNTGLGWVSTEF
jgi:hypothetical protein